MRLSCAKNSPKCDPKFQDSEDLAIGRNRSDPRLLSKCSRRWFNSLMTEKLGGGTKLGLGHRRAVRQPVSGHLGKPRISEVGISKASKVAHAHMFSNLSYVVIVVTSPIATSYETGSVKYLTLSNLRRLSQIVFLLLFVLLLLRTEYRGSLQVRGDEIRLPYPVQLFFQLDPLVAVSNALASRALYHGLIWSLLVLIPTLFFGRFFCGWICPMGTLNHFFSSLKSESKRGKQLITSNRYKPWQKTKYYLLIAVLVAALLGTGLVGLARPFSFLVRSLGLSILPGLNYAVNA